LDSSPFASEVLTANSGTETVAAQRSRFTRIAISHPRCSGKIAKDIGLSVEDMLAGRSSQQQDSAAKANAVETRQETGPPETRGD
jgi:hypothetical protein